VVPHQTNHTREIDLLKRAINESSATNGMANVCLADFVTHATHSYTRIQYDGLADLHKNSEDFTLKFSSEMTYLVFLQPHSLLHLPAIRALYMEKMRSVGLHCIVL